ncbi:MAG: hypothetical protein OXG03_04565 [Gammaproteobacteria bacterium]|nr:hypothetical protein [Gammaproteobacteria bacterium]
MSKGKKIDLAWEKILEEVTAIEQEVSKKGYCEIQSSQIKKHGNNCEPRLACKIDYRQNIPKPLEERGLSVLAVRNGRYKIARTDPFISIDETQCEGLVKCGPFRIPDHIQTISSRSINSESKALDAAFASRMLEAVLGEEVDLVLRGREFCQPIKFSLPDRKDGNKVRYHVKKVQLEVDGGYEGKDGIYLIEAKIGRRDNINLRQLLYPHLHYESLYGKLVRTYVLFYEPSTSHFHFYRFRHQDKCLSDYRCCTLETDFANYCWNDLCAAIDDNCKTDKNAPFPQADSLEKVLAALLKLDQCGPLTKEELFADENITPRQYDYYASALRWMKLAKSSRGPDGVQCLLTGLGSSLAKKPMKETLFEIAKIIFSNDFCRLFLHEEDPDFPEEILRNNRLNREKTTFGRRIETIKSWKRYFRNHFPE